MQDGSVHIFLEQCGSEPRLTLTMRQMSGSAQNVPQRDTMT